MPTFSDLKTKVAKKLFDPNNTAVSDADVGNALNDALHFWKQRRFWFNEKVAVVTMNVNDPIIPSIPSDFLYELPQNGFVINWNNLSYTLYKKHPQEYDSTNIKGLGVPYIYTWRNGKFEVYFYPNIAYSLSIYYVCNYNDLSASSDSNDFTTYADRLLYYDALSRLFGEHRQDGNLSAYYKQRAEEEAEQLFVRSATHAANGSLSVDTIL